MIEPVVLVHGGAGDIPADKQIQTAKIDGVKCAAKQGYATLLQTGSVLDAVEAAVRCMEDNTAFNSGHGAVLNIEGDISLDASIMEGADLRVGCVGAVEDIAHPISLARLVMEKTPHSFLVGKGANKFAKEQGIKTVPAGSLVTQKSKEDLEMFKHKGAIIYTKMGPSLLQIGGVGTVGAVAIDKYGHVAAATSTGGTTGKMVGRVGDSPVIGSGTYADDNIGAVSSTGHGETILKYCLAYAILKSMETGKSASEATKSNLQNMTKKLNNTAGAITLSSTGEIGIGFTTNRMSWAYQRKNEVHYGLEQEQDEIEML